MYEFILLIRDFMMDLIGLLNAVSFSIGNTSVSYGGLIFAFLVVGIVVSVFWKGAKT